MMKKLSLFVFALFVSLLFINEIKGEMKLTCEYKQHVSMDISVYAMTKKAEFAIIENDGIGLYTMIEAGSGYDIGEYMDEEVYNEMIRTGNYKEIETDENKYEEYITIIFNVKGDKEITVQSLSGKAINLSYLGDQYTVDQWKTEWVNPIIMDLSYPVLLDEIELNESYDCPEHLTLGVTYNGKFIISGQKLTTYKKYSHKLNNSSFEVSSVEQCYNYKKEKTCRNSKVTGNVACVWTENEAAPNEGFCNVDNLLYVGCGGASDIPIQVPQLIAFAVNVLKIATPIILIFMGMITLLKAMSSGKEDEMKKATSSLVKKLIAAAMVFFIVAIVQFIVSKVTSDEDDYTNFSNCLKCFLNNDCENAYYKTVVGGKDYCTQLTTGEPKECNSTEE